MKIQKITIDPDPYERFRLAQGYRVGELLFISGQAAIDGNGQLVGVGNFDAQAEQVFANLKRVLRAGGSSLANVIKVTIFLRDMSNFPKIVELRGRYFTPPYPADTIVEVTSLYSPEALVEMSWARLLKRVFEIDMEHCSQRGGTLTIIAAIEHPPVITKMLTHLGLPARAPPRAAARAFDRFQLA